MCNTGIEIVHVGLQNSQLSDKLLSATLKQV